MILEHWPVFITEHSMDIGLDSWCKVEKVNTTVEKNRW